ncbi:hypothetical protein K443DRAFT_95311, partial [Laccaria amethystina LaAM-08-1]
ISLSPTSTSWPLHSRGEYNEYEHLVPCMNPLRIGRCIFTISEVISIWLRTFSKRV